MGVYVVRVRVCMCACVCVHVCVCVCSECVYDVLCDGTHGRACMEKYSAIRTSLRPQYLHHFLVTLLSVLY